MASIKTIPGSQFLLALDEADNVAAGSETFTIIGGSTGCSVNFTQEAIDTTNKESGGRKAFINGVSSWTVDCEQFYSVDTTIKPSTLYAALDAGNKVSIKFYLSSGQTGAKKYQGKGFITALTLNAPNGEFATYSLSLQGTGQFTEQSV
mgnify:CR=1 FL=1|jgi:predicted secreted protein